MKLFIILTVFALAHFFSPYKPANTPFATSDTTCCKTGTEISAEIAKVHVWMRTPMTSDDVKRWIASGQKTISLPKYGVIGVIHDTAWKINQ